MGATRERPVGEGGHIIEDEGVPLAQRAALNFLGPGVTAADAPGKTNVTIPGGGGADVTFELLKTINLGADAQTATITLDTPVDFADFSEIVFVISGILRDNPGNIVLFLNGKTGAGNSIYSFIGVQTTETPLALAAFASTTSTTLEFQNQPIQQNSPFYIKWVVEGGAILDALSKRQGYLDAGFIRNTDGLYSSSRGMTMINPLADTQLSSISVAASSIPGSTIGQNSILTIYGKKLVGGAGGGGGHIIEDEGISLPAQPDLNFVGNGVNVTNDIPNTATVVTIEGGNLEFLGETTLAIAALPVTVSFPPVDLADYCYFKAVFVGVLNNNTNVGWQINGLGLGQYVGNALRWSGVGNATSGGLSSTDAIILTAGPGGTGFFSELIIQAGVNIAGKIFLMADATNDDSPLDASTNRGYVTTAATTLSSVTMNGLSENWNVGAKLCVYGFRKDGTSGGGGAGNGHVIEDEGTPIVQQSNLNFVGAGVVAADIGGKSVITIPGGGHIIEDEGTPLPAQPDLNFVGTGVTVTDDIPNTATVVTIPQLGHVIEDEGTPLAQQVNMNFVGAGVTVTDAGGKTVITIPGGGGGGGSGLTRETLGDPFTAMWFYDEFYYPDPQNGLLLHYERDGNSFTVPTDVARGQVEIGTLAQINAIARINTCGGGLQAIDPAINFRLVFKSRVTSTGTLIASRIGAYNNQFVLPGGVFPFATPPAVVVWFKLDGTGNWFAETDNGVTVNSTDTGVARDTAFHVFEIRSDPLVPSYEFLIDDVIVATFTTNLPTALMAIYEGVQTGAASVRAMVFDAIFMYNGDAETPGGGGGHVIEDEGIALPAQPALNFVGAGVTATDDIPNSATVVTIPGGGGSGSGLTRPTLNNPIQDLWFYDEMYYPDPANGLLVHYETGIFQVTVPNNVVGGQVRITTANVVNDISRINTCGGGLAAINTGVDFKVVFRTKVENVGVTAAARLGAFKHQGSLPGGVFPFATPPAQVVWFKLDGTGNWFAETDNGVTVNSQDTGVVRDTAFHTFEIRSDATVPNIQFLIDGLIKATFTTDLPTGDFTIYEGVQTNSASDKQLVLDSIFIFNERAGGGPSGGGGSGAAGPFELLKTITTVADAAGITTITLDSPVLLEDFSEFELTIHGVSLVAAAGCGIILNGLVDSTYSTQGISVNATNPILPDILQINEGSAPKWAIQDAAVPLGIGEGFYIKLILQGGALASLGTGSALLGSATMAYGKVANDLNSSVVNIRKTFAVDPPQTQLISFGLKMDGLMQLKAGAVLSVYGKKLVAGGGGSGGSGVFDPFSVEPNDYYYFLDEFFYPNLELTTPNAHWEKLGDLTPVTPNGVVGGVVDFSTQALANALVGIRTCGGGLVAVTATKKFKVVWACQQTTAIATSAQRIGLFAAGASPSGTFPFSLEPTPHMWFAHDGAGNYLAQTGNGVTPVSIDTSVTVDSLMHVFEISFDPTATTPTVTFKIDGLIVAQSSANIPVGDLSVGNVIQTQGAVTKTVRIDTAMIVNDR